MEAGADTTIGVSGQGEDSWRRASCVAGDTTGIAASGEGVWSSKKVEVRWSDGDRKQDAKWP